MNQNICKFVPVRNTFDHINTINFVYETVIPQKNQFITKSTYMMYLVTEGTGRLRHMQKSCTLKKGDLFFTFPSVPFAIQVDDSSLRYIYISFLGVSVPEKSWRSWVFIPGIAYITAMEFWRTFGMTHLRSPISITWTCFPNLFCYTRFLS